MARDMKDSGIAWIGRIPSTWTTKRIGGLYSVRNEKVSDKVFMPLSVTMKGVVPQLETAAKTNDGDNRKLVRKGDFAINSRSDRRGSCGISSYDGSVSLINTVLTPRTEMNPQYYDWLFHTIQFADEFYKWGHGIVDDLWTTGWQEMKRIFIPVPTHEEQEKIASFLNSKCFELDSLSSDIQKEIEKLEAYKKSLITEVVTKGLDKYVPTKASGYDYLGSVPIFWDVRRLRFLGTCSNGISKSHEYFGSGFPFVTYGDVYNNFSLPETSSLIESSEIERRRYSVEKGDIFFTRTSETIEEIAFSSACLKTIEKACFAGFLIRFRPTVNMSTNFLMYYFRSDIHRKFFTKEMNLVTRASLSQDLLKNLPVLIPPRKEQDAIAEFLDSKCSEIDSLISSKKQQLETLAAYKKSLIYEYVTGKKEVPAI